MPKRIELPPSAVEEYRAGEPAYRIAERYGYSAPAVRRWLRRRGVEMRVGSPPSTEGKERRRAAARLRLQRRYDQRIWIEDPSYRPRFTGWGGYWLHPDPPKGHGDPSSYIQYGCRCPACREAWSEYQSYVSRGATAQYYIDRGLPLP